MRAQEIPCRILSIKYIVALLGKAVLRHVI